jgi:hypothetical protein
VGVENTWIRVQNMGSADANIELKYMKEDGTIVATEACPTWGVCPAIAPGAALTFSESQDPALPQGFLGSAVITSDQPIAVLLGRDSDRGGGFSTDGSTVALNAGSGQLFLPLVSSRDGPGQNWDSRFAVENLGDSTACATLVYLSNTADAEVRQDPDEGASPSPTPSPGCPKGGIAIPPGGSLLRSWVNMGVGPYFTGSVRVDLQTNGQNVPASKQVVVASADVFSSSSKHFASYAGFSASDMGTSLLLPLMERQANGQWSTDFEIMNSDPTQPATVTLRIDGWDSSQNPPQYIVKQNTFQLRSSRMCFQDSNDSSNCLAPGDALPLNFTDGVGVITSDKPVGVVVSRSSNSSDTYVGYRSVRLDAASQKLYLPLVNKNSPTAASRTGWNSWVRVLVADGGSANLTVRYISPALPGGESSYTIPIFRTVTLIQPWDGAVPDGFTGSAILESDRPIVALGDVTVGNSPGDMDLMYNGVVGP